MPIASTIIRLSLTDSVRVIVFIHLMAVQALSKKIYGAKISIIYENSK